jgi:putative endonuclease
MSAAAEKPADGKDKPTRAGAWTLYLIECRDGSIYTGIAIDVAARYAAHAAGKGARYTRAHPPARLLATVEYPDHSSALKAEYRIKQLTAAAKRAFVSELPTRPSEDQTTP